MTIQPGRTDGGRPQVGPRLEIRLTENQLMRVDWIVSEAKRRYDRVPREMRSRAAVIRTTLDGCIWELEARIQARPEPEE